MNRSVLLAIAVCFLCGAAPTEEVFLLRVDTVGYIDQPVSEKEPKETVLRSIEVIVRPEFAFHSKVKTGKQTLVLAGNLRSSDNGGFVVQLRYVDLIDTGISVPTTNGGRNDAPDKSAVKTAISIALGDSVTIGGFETTVSEPGRPDRRSKTRQVLVLTEYKLTDD